MRVRQRRGWVERSRRAREWRRLVRTSRGLLGMAGVDHQGLSDFAVVRIAMRGTKQMAIAANQVGVSAEELARSLRCIAFPESHQFWWR